MEEYAWVTAFDRRYKQIEADYNAEWASMAYLDGPGYTVMDRIEAKLDLRRKYFSGSSFHGVVNSPKEILTQPIESHHISTMAESNRQSNLCMAECAREIRESCARILKLLQEESDVSESLDVDASESLDVDASESYTATSYAIVEHGCCGKERSLNKISSVVTDPEVPNVTVALTLPEILPLDPSDIVPVPPPPLAPPWLTSPIYSQVWLQQYSGDFIGGISHLLSTSEGGISSFKPLAIFTPHSPTATCSAFLFAWMTPLWIFPIYGFTSHVKAT